MTITGYEIDFLAVGEKLSSADALLFRYKENGLFKVILIDGGHKESDGVKTSDTILKHLREYYFPDAKENTEIRIEHIICSHPDSDHVGGLQEIMEKCEVGTFWINNPLNYISKSKLADPTDNDSKNNNAFSKAHAETVESLLKVAEEQQIEVDAPLQGKYIGPLLVASPSMEFYQSLVKGELKRRGSEKASFKKAATSAIKMIWAKWDEDALFEFPATSVRNESSTVLYGKVMDKPYRILLTADAGIEALSRAYDYLSENNGFNSESLTFIQMPHHGGRYNVNVEVLDNLLGTKIPQSSGDKRGITIVSVAKEETKNPRSAVKNAFISRGYPCFSTHGVTVWHCRGDMPKREEFSPVKPLEYSSQVEKIE